MAISTEFMFAEQGSVFPILASALLGKLSLTLKKTGQGHKWRISQVLRKVSRASLKQLLYVQEDKFCQVSKI